MSVFPTLALLAGCRYRAQHPSKSAFSPEMLCVARLDDGAVVQVAGQIRKNRMT